MLPIVKAMNISDRKLPENLIPVSCNRDCGGGCPLAAEMKDGRPVRIINNPLRPDKDIRGCSRGYRALDQALSADRLTSPLKRKGPRGSGGFEPVSWDQALDEIAGKLTALKSVYGPEALMVLAGSGACRGAVHTTSGLTKRFFSLWGKFTTTKGYYSNTAAMFAAQSVFGIDRAGQDPETLLGARAVILWGANIRDVRFGAKTEPVLKALKEKGIPFFVIDPRLSRTASLFAGATAASRDDDDSLWLAIYPGTDAALMASLLFQWIKNDQIDRRFIERYTSGFEDLESWVTGNSDGIPKTPEWAAAICGIKTAQITNLAAVYGRAAPAALIPGLSIQRVVGGEEAYRMGMALQAARGSIGVFGGTSGGVLWDTMPGPRVRTARDLSDLPHRFGSRTIPVNNWQDAVISASGGEWLEAPGIHGIYSVGNNYILQSSDQAKTRAAFEAVDFSVCHDLFLTGTACWSDYVLPATHFLERDDIVTAGENYLYYSHKVLGPPGEARNDFDIFRALAGRLGFEKDFTRGLSPSGWIDACLADSDVFDQKGFREIGFFDPREHGRILLSDFIADPENAPLNTPDGRINFRCKKNARYGYPQHPHYRPDQSLRETQKGESLRMITPHGRHRTNSQHSNLPWFKEKEYPLLHMHPADAAVRGICDGARVRLKNEQGTLVLPVHLTEEVRPGVVWTFQGHWDIEDSPNRLTSTRSSLPSHGSRTHSIGVFIEPIDSDPGEVD